jgi:hypothetical protein
VLATPKTFGRIVVFTSTNIAGKWGFTQIISTTALDEVKLSYFAAEMVTGTSFDVSNLIVIN